MKFDLGWGNSVSVREALAQSVPIIFLKQKKLLDLNYPPHDGDPDLIRITKEVCFRQLGLRPAHVLITNGATGGIRAALQAFGLPVRIPSTYFPLYPQIVSASGQVLATDPEQLATELVDHPSNPTGRFWTGTPTGPLVWDACYANRIYCGPDPFPVPNHDVLVGSYGKLLGLNGTRIGFLATDSNPVFAKLQSLVTGSYCGIDINAQTGVLDLVQTLDWDRFENLAIRGLDNNRTEWQTLERYFEHPVTGIGMFFWSRSDSRAQELLTSAGITWTPGSICGADDTWVRINLGQSNSVISAAVRAVRNQDRI